MRPTRIRKEQLRGLADVAFSGDYNDLENTPAIPSGQGQAAGTLNTDNTATLAVNNSESLGGNVNLHKVAKTGDYNHLNNRPTIPTVRTMNGEQLTDSSLGDINIYDGFYFPNAVQDFDGNWYGAVVVGNQVWLAENLRTTHYADGTNIPINTAYPNNSDPFYWVGSNNEYYYNHPAAIQKTLLDGFHLPTKDEVETLRTYISKQVRYRLQNNEEVIAKSLAATSGWVVPNSYSNDVPGKNQSANNKTGFNLKPAGHAGYGNVMRVWFEGEVAAIWTATGSGENVYTLCVRNSLEWCQIGNQFYSAAFGLSIRCVSDLTPIQFRNWYVETYGSMQHHLPDSLQHLLPDYSQHADESLCVHTGGNGVPDGLEWLKKNATWEGVCMYNSTEGKYIADIDFDDMKLKFGDIVVIDFPDGLGAAGNFWYEHGGTLYQLSFTTPMTYYQGMIVPGDTCVFLWSDLHGGLELLTRSSAGNGVFYGVTNSPANSSTKVVTLSNPADKFKDGSCLILSFGAAVTAVGVNLIQVGSDTYGLTYRGQLVTAAGVINAGDKVLMYCINAVAHIISIDRWGADIAGKQDALVASGANQNIKTINLLSLLGSGNITLLPTHTLHTTTIATAGSTTTVTCAANERAFHIVKVNAANCTLCIDILNGWDNTIYVYGSQNVNIIFKIGGVQATTIFELNDQFAGLTAILTKAGAMKFVVEIVDDMAFVDVDAMDSLTPSV